MERPSHADDPPLRVLRSVPWTESGDATVTAIPEYLFEGEFPFFSYHTLKHLLEYLSLIPRVLSTFIISVRFFSFFFLFLVFSYSSLFHYTFSTTTTTTKHHHSSVAPLASVTQRSFFRTGGRPPILDGPNNRGRNNNHARGTLEKLDRDRIAPQAPDRLFHTGRPCFHLPRTTLYTSNLDANPSYPPDSVQ